MNNYYLWTHWLWSFSFLCCLKLDNAFWHSWKGHLINFDPSIIMVLCFNLWPLRDCQNLYLYGLAMGTLIWSCDFITGPINWKSLLTSANLQSIWAIFACVLCPRCIGYEDRSHRSISYKIFMISSWILVFGSKWWVLCLHVSHKTVHLLLSIHKFEWNPNFYLNQIFATLVIKSRSLGYPYRQIYI